MSKSVDVAIIGGGLAGGVAGYHLASRGVSTTLFEKEKGPHHKVCGEFLSGEALQYLQDIGLDVFALGAVKIKTFRLHAPDASFEQDLPTPAYGLSRYRLDEAVLRSAANAGVKIVSSMVSAVEDEADGSGLLRIHTKEDQVLAERVLVATGKFELKIGRPRRGRDSSLIGFKMHLKVKPSVYQRLKESIDLFVFPHGYGGLSPIEEGLVNFCFVISKQKVKEIGADWKSLSTYIARRNWQASRDLDGAEPQFERFVTCAQIPYGYINSSSADSRVYHVGDQLAVIPSLTGDGMCIALDSARTVVDYVSMLSGNNQQALSREYYRKMYGRVKVPIELALGLHRLFAHPEITNWAVRAMKQAPWLLRPLYFGTRVRFGARPPELEYLRTHALGY